MQGLSLEDHLFNGDAKLIDPDDDLIFDSEMNDFGSDVDDDELILQSEQMYVEDLMDQGFDELILKKAMTQMVNSILQQHHKFLEGHLIDEDDYQDQILWVKTKEEERTTSSISKSPPSIFDTIEIEPCTNMLDDGNIWIEIYSKMQFNYELTMLQHR